MDLTDLDIWREIHYQVADLRNSADGQHRDIRKELALHIQETRFHREEVLRRLDRLEAKTSKPLIDWQSIIERLWFKVVVLILLATGNVQLIKAAAVLFKN